jgi:hypothetical protein
MTALLDPHVSHFIHKGLLISARIKRIDGGRRLIGQGLLKQIAHKGEQDFLAMIKVGQIYFMVPLAVGAPDD